MKKPNDIDIIIPDGEWDKMCAEQDKMKKAFDKECAKYSRGDPDADLTPEQMFKVLTKVFGK